MLYVMSNGETFYTLFHILFYQDIGQIFGLELDNLASHDKTMEVTFIRTDMFEIERRTISAYIRYHGNHI